jgi:hypothetical protein
MAILLNVCPVEINLCISRGDTQPWTFTVKEGTPAVAKDITGFSYLLTVDPSPEPTGSGNNLFQLSGSLTDPTNGVVQFEMSAAQADQTPNEYYYDLQQTDGAGDIRTIAKGKFTFNQDITK